jgi:antirestriction protein ArdC
MKASAVCESVTAAIVEQLERAEDLGPWVAPWHGRHGMPRNAATGNQYRGGNVVALWAAQIRQGHTSEVWATYRQWAELGRQVQRGQKASYGIKWIDKTRSDDGSEPGEVNLAEVERRAFPVGFAVFNYAQTDPAEGFEGVAWKPPSPKSCPDSIPAYAEFFDCIGAVISTGAPAYSPARDTIFMPALEAFDDAEAYYATSAHEYCHWTGHASRLARDLSGRFGSDAYAAEELIAELGAAFVAALLGMETSPRADHAQYISSWLRVLRSDSSALFPVATASQAAADYLIAASEGTIHSMASEAAA